MPKENQTKSSKTAKRAARIGGFSVLISAIVLCILVILNMIVYALPADYIIFDTSGLGLSDISDKSKKFLSELDQDVTIYWLCENNEMDETLGMVAAAYTEHSDHIELSLIDPIADPTFTSKYSSSKISNFSFIVESDLRSTVIDASDFYYFTNDFVTQQLNGGTTLKLSQDEFYSLYESYGAYMDIAPSNAYFQGEALLTSAIDYVTLPTIPHTYVLTGHGENKLPDPLTSALNVYQIAPEEINLQNAGSIPEDASCIILFAPKTDLTPNEASLLSSYVQTGGSLLLVTSPNCVNFENLASVTALFGMTAEEGMVIDDKENYYYQQTYGLVPLVNTSLSPLYTIYNAGYYAYMPQSHSIRIAKQADLPDKVSATALFATSDQAYRISTDGNKTKLSDPASLYVGAYGIITGTSENGTAIEGKLTWFASSDAFSDTAAKEFSGSNYFYMSLMTRYMSNLYASPYANIQGINITTPTLDNMTSSSGLALGIVTVVIIPIAFLTTGLVIWLKRRSR